MVDFIICALANLFRMYLIRRFIVIFLGKLRIDKKKEIIAFLCFYVVNTALFWQFHTAWINILSNLIGISVIARLYTKSAKTNIFVTSTIYFINCACDIVATLMFVNYQEGDLHSQISFVLTVFFICMSEILAEKVVSNRNNPETVQNFSLLLVPVCSIAVICILIYSNACKNFGMIVISISFLIMNFLMLYLYDLLLHSISQKYETEVLKQKVQIYANQLDIILQSEEKIRILSHDMKHHMNELKILGNKHNVKEIEEYIDDMEISIENPNEIIFSGNIEIDSVLNYMLNKAKKELTTVTINVVLPEKIQHFFDINILLGNLLENAIEAAKQTEQKYLDVYITLKKGILKIKIENSFLPENLVYIKNKNGQKIFLTTKSTKESHGIGLKSVKEIVEKHNGIMEIASEDNIFCVSLIMYMLKFENDI